MMMSLIVLPVMDLWDVVMMPLMASETMRPGSPCFLQMCATMLRHKVGFVVPVMVASCLKSFVA